MFIWLRTTEGIDAMNLYKRILEGEIMVIPGKPFHVRGSRNTIHLNFATLTEEQIIDRMRVLVDACKKLYSR